VRAWHRTTWSWVSIPRQPPLRPAGGHRGNFLTEDMSRQIGTFALVPQVVDSVSVPVIAAGGVADARGVVNRLMREQGPLSSVTPEFPLAAAALAPLRAKSEAAGSGDFTNLWSGQAVRLARRPTPAGELTRLLARQTLDKYEVASSATDDWT
jgi:nitronate monooxygenase